jgi:hypothetical protein
VERFGATGSQRWPLTQARIAERASPFTIPGRRSDKAERPPDHLALTPPWALVARRHDRGVRPLGAGGAAPGGGADGGGLRRLRTDQRERANDPPIWPQRPQTRPRLAGCKRPPAATSVCATRPHPGSRYLSPVDGPGRSLPKRATEKPPVSGGFLFCAWQDSNLRQMASSRPPVSARVCSAPAAALLRASLGPRSAPSGYV